MGSSRLRLKWKLKPLYMLAASHLRGDRQGRKTVASLRVNASDKGAARAQCSKLAGRQPRAERDSRRGRARRGDAARCARR